MRQKLLGAEHPDVAIGLSSLASVLENQGKYEAAEALIRQALAMRQKLLGTDHPKVADSLNQLGDVFTSQGKYEAAVTYLHCHPSEQQLAERIAAFVDSLLDDPTAVHKRLRPKLHLSPQEEFLRV